MKPVRAALGAGEHLLAEGIRVWIEPQEPPASPLAGWQGRMKLPARVSPVTLARRSRPDRLALSDGRSERILLAEVPAGGARPFPSWGLALWPERPRHPPCRPWSASGGGSARVVRAGRFRP